MVSKILATFLLVGTALSVPTPDVKSYWEEQRFTLVAKATEPNAELSVDNLVVTSVHSGAGQAVAVLVNPTVNAYNASPSYFFQNGTGDEVASGLGNVLGDDSDERWPYGLVIGSGPDSAAPYPVMVNIGAGTPAVGVRGVSYTDPSASGRPFLAVDRFNGSQTDVSVFYACNAYVLGADVPQLLWREQGAATPDGCVELELLPQCAGNVTTTVFLDTVQNTPCYPDATGVSI